MCPQRLLLMILNWTLIWVWGLPIPSHAQLIINCNIQFLSAGAFITQVGPQGNSTNNSGTLSATPLNLGSNCGSISYSSSTRLYRWTPSTSLSVQYLLVAGGGAGGGNWGGGGGGGGVLTGSFSSTQNTNYDFSVGSGGVGASSPPPFYAGNSGGNTVGFGLTAYGGGGGGGGYFYTGTNGYDGGSGGGGGENTTALGVYGTSGGKGTVGQGFAGGNQIVGSSSSPWSVGGGGGGAGSAGESGRSFANGSGGTGGAGLISSITGSPVVYSAGGGGGGATSYGTLSGQGGSSGAGGQGNSTPGLKGGNATTLGSGGGGGAFNNGANGSGMDGTVVIAFSGSAPYTPNSNNTFLGNQAGLSNTSAFNTFLGAKAGQYDINGHGNIYVGASSGPVANSTNPIYYGVIAFGAAASVPSVLTQNAIAIGYQSAAVNNQIKLGNSSLVSFKVGNLSQWSTSSDRQLKSEVQDATRGLPFIKALRPVEFKFKTSEVKRLGFIAQEVERLDPTFPGVIAPGHAEDFYSLNYEAFIPALVKAVQTVHDHIKAQEREQSQSKHSTSLLQNESVLLMGIALTMYLMLVCFLIFLEMHWSHSVFQRLGS